MSSALASIVASSSSSSVMVRVCDLRESVSTCCSFATVTTPLRVNSRCTDPPSAMVPPLRVTATRTSEIERLRLSVRHSMRIATPAGP